MDRLRDYLNKGYAITPRITGVLVGSSINDYYTTDIMDYHIEVDNHQDGSGTVTITHGSDSWTLVFRESSKYPDMISGNDKTLNTSSGFVKDGRLIASSLDKYNGDLKELGNPYIDIRDLQKTEKGEEEIISILGTLSKKGIQFKLDEEGGNIIVLPAAVDVDIDLSELSGIIGRMYYPTTRPDTITHGKYSPVKQTSMDLFTEDDTPIGSTKAVKIMSETPTYLNRELVDSLPNIDPGTAETTNEVLKSKYMTPKAFKRIQNAFANGTLEELYNNKEFIHAWRHRNYKKIREQLGLFKEDPISKSLYVLYGINSNDLDNALKVYEDPISVDHGKKLYNVFTDPKVKSISDAKVFTDEYLKYNDVNEAMYNMFTSRGERMYADGETNYQATSLIRENLRFAPTDASNIDKGKYKKNLLQTIGGSLVEDGYIDTHNIKYTGKELEKLAKKFVAYGYDDESLTPRLKAQLRAYNNLDEFGVVDTGLSTTLDATFSGLAVNSAITGKTENVDMINIKDHTVKDKDVDNMRDLYSEVGEPLIDALVKEGVDRKKARKLVKPGIMSAMYNSSERSRTQSLIEKFKQELTEVPDVYKFIKKVKPQIKETTKEATNILTTTVRENDVMDLIDKGIIEVYKSDNGMPVPYDPKEIPNMISKTAGIKINKPDGTHTTIMNDASTLEFKDGILQASKGDHVKPFVETVGKQNGVYVEKTNNKKFLDNISTAIARSYDSYVASYIVENLHKEGIPVVTTHDAFTVPVYATDRTKELYNEALNNLYEFGGSDKRVNARNNLSVE